MKKFFLGIIVGIALGSVGTIGLAMVAVVVLPQMTNRSTDARENSTSSTLQTLRSQIELFKIQHADTPPDPAGMWTVMTGHTNVADVRTPSPGGIYGPYLQSPPVNPLNGQSAVGPRPAKTVGWVYTVSGSIYTLQAVNAKGNDVMPY